MAALHHDHIKERIGDNRRFIRCDRFPASCPHFLSRLSKVIGAGIDNPEDLISLRPSLSSKEMVIVLDNAESILDPQGANGWEIYGIVEELTRFGNVCLVITTRITTIPPDCETLNIPTLSTGAAQVAFYHIYKHGGRSDSVNGILNQLDFHPLSVTLLATVAHQNEWDDDRLTREWEQRRTGVLRTEHQTSLAASIELSLASPLFNELGPDARGLLGVVAFYPQGVNEKNISWLFLTAPDVPRIFDKFCILSLTYRSNGFITMLVPLRDHLRPNDPQSFPLFCETKERYFARMAVEPEPQKIEFKDTRWIVSEDVNVEHLLDVLTSVDPDSKDVWDACLNFTRYLAWHKPRQIVLSPKIEALPIDHPSKPECLFAVAVLFSSIGNFTEQIRLLNIVLKLRREQRNGFWVAFTLERLSGANRMLGLHKEGIHQAAEALQIYQRLGTKARVARCLDQLARLFHDVGQLDAAEEAAIHSSKLLPEKGEEFKVCLSHRTLGNIYCPKGEKEKAIYRLKMSLEIASSFNWQDHQFWTHFALAGLFLTEREFEDAHGHITQAKSHVLNDTYYLGRTALLQAGILFGRSMLEDATSEVLRALEIFEKVCASKDLERCRAALQVIEGGVENGVTLSGSGELLERVSCLALVDPLSSALSALFYRAHSLP